MYNGILFSLKPEENTVICDHIDKAAVHYTKLNNQTQKDKYCFL